MRASCRDVIVRVARGELKTVACRSNAPGCRRIHHLVAFVDFTGDVSLAFRPHAHERRAPLIISARVGGADVIRTPPMALPVEKCKRAAACTLRHRRSPACAPNIRYFGPARLGKAGRLGMCIEAETQARSVDARYRAASSGESPKQETH